MVRIRSSIVWRFFDKTDNNTITCRICKKRMKNFGNTSNLKQHITRRHPNDLSEEEAIIERSQEYLTYIVSDTSPTEVVLLPTGTSLATCSTPKTSVGSKVKNKSNNSLVKKRPRLENESDELPEKLKEEIDRCILKMTVSDYHLLSLVDSKGFLEYSKKLQPLYTPPTKEMLTTMMLPNLYDEIKEQVSLMLNAIDYVAASTYIWATDEEKSYITIMCHFIYDDRLYSLVLATREILESDTEADLAFILKTIFCDWDIDTKIVTIVSDDEENVKSIANKHLNVKHHPSLVGILNLTVEDAIISCPQLSAVIEKCREITLHFRQSIAASTKLKEVQVSMGLDELKISPDVSVTWNSSLPMLERLGDMKGPVSITLTDLPYAPQNLDASEWMVVSDVVKLLKPIETMMKELSGEKYSALSFIVPLVRGLRLKLEQIATETSVGKYMKDILLENIDARLAHVETVEYAAKATFLDPRLKKTAFSQSENANAVEKQINDEVTDMIDNYYVNTVTVTTNNAEEGTSENNSDSLWCFFEEKLSQVETTVMPSTTGILLVKQYLEMPHWPRTQNPLDFWRLHKNNLSTLYRIHLKYSCVPASSVPPENLFSRAKINNLLKNRLSPKTLDRITFLNSYFVSESED